MGLLVEARLGRGRLLETVAARLDERAVVIKRPRPELVRAPGFGAALAAWGESQQELTHPNLVAVLGVEQTIDGPVVVQQRIDGATLGAVEKALTRRKRGFQPAMALMIIRDVGRALQYLQQQGRCHGGLDPQDVLLGYDGRAWLSDPGLSALEEQTAGAIEPSSGLSPYQGEPEASFAGDIYAAGLLLLEMLLGQPLWTKEKMNVTAALAAFKDFTSIGQAQPQLTERLLQLLGGCLKPAPSERITAEVLVAATEHIIAEQALPASPDALGELVRAAVPPPEAADAPTMMVSPSETEALAQAHALRVERMEGASLAVDPELEAKVLTRAGRPPSNPVATPLPMAVLTAPRHASVPPAAPSLRREQEVPNVHRVAKQAQEQFQLGMRREILWAGAGVLLVLILGLYFGTGSDDPPIRLILGSEPVGAAVFADGKLIGITPLDQTIPLDGMVKLRFELEGYEPHGLSIGTEAGEIRYDAKLKPVAPQ
jgi:hypothetical protein